MEEGKTYPGHSEFGFSMAAKDAVERFEEENGKPGPDETITLRVVEMTVTFENPIRDYSVVLG